MDRLPEEIYIGIDGFKKVRDIFGRHKYYLSPSGRYYFFPIREKKVYWRGADFWYSTDYPLAVIEFDGELVYRRFIENPWTNPLAIWSD